MNPMNRHDIAACGQSSGRRPRRTTITRNCTDERAISLSTPKSIFVVAPLLLIGLMMTAGGGCPMNMNGAMPPPQNVPLVYGNGSAGARVVNSDENWNNADQAPTNLQFTNLTIEAGATLMLPSGMTIRCTGTFTNNGNVVVRTGADGGFAGASTAEGDFSTLAVAPVAGIGTLAAQASEGGSSSSARLGGRGGFGISEFEARQVLVVGTAAGGGGAAAGTDSQPGIPSINVGSSGGGSVRILAAGTITNAAGASITADGDDGEGGGGGGGVIIMASMTSITQAGTVSARGGDGESGDSNEAPSGGGGGGLVHLLAPSITSTGAVDVSGGAAGAIGPGVSAVTRFGGGGGGASGGSGGNGGSVPGDALATPTAATAGAAGFSIETLTDPTSLF